MNRAVELIERDSGEHILFTEPNSKLPVLLKNGRFGEYTEFDGFNKATKLPPEDKPKNTELIKCSNYFISELDQLKKLKVIVALGKVAFDNCLKIYKKKFNMNKKFEFKHGKKYLLPDNKILIACYHPSPRNVNTKVITPLMINSLFKKAKKFSML